MYYYLKTADGSTLADIKPYNDNPSQGVNAIIPLNFFADTDAKRHLSVSTSGVTADVKGFFIIKYIA
jgi:hypothetical protein